MAFVITVVVAIGRFASLVFGVVLLSAVAQQVARVRLDVAGIALALLNDPPWAVFGEANLSASSAN